MMERRHFLRNLAFSGAGLTRIPWLKAAPPDKPNFVFVLVDDLGWADINCVRQAARSVLGVKGVAPTVYETPNIDRLAESGMLFTDAYAACPVCSPTRASIMTGKYPARVGITDWIPGSDPKNRKLLAPADLHQLPLGETTIAEVLKTAGYRTFFAGKWHLGGTGFLPEDQGFDINKGGHHKGSPPGGYYAPWSNPKLENGPAGEYLPDRLTRESIAFVESARDDPFLLYLSFYTVHTPIQACKRHIETYEKKVADMADPAAPEFRIERNGRTRIRQTNAAFASMVHAMDENVGRLMDAIEANGVAGKTVVIFMSDNGGLSTLGGKRLAPTSNEPLRAGKGWCYEGGIREPMIIRAPGVTKPGSVCRFPVTSTDFYPTMLELAGLPLQPEQHADGLSLMPLLKGGESLPREAIFWHYPHYHGSTWTPGAAVRMGDWKLIEFYEEGKAELYNLADDLSEKSDLSTSNPDMHKRLLDALHAWQKQIGAKMPVPNPNFKG